jgi:hypothetical protein
MHEHADRRQGTRNGSSRCRRRRSNRFRCRRPTRAKPGALLERQPHGRMGFDVHELGNHVFADHRVDAFPHARICAPLVDEPHVVRIAQPPGDGRHMLEALPHSDRRHRAAIRVTADHDVRNAERNQRIFDGRCYAARFGPVWRHDVSGVADHEEIARIALSNELGHHPAVRARDEQRARSLAGGQSSEEIGALREDVALKPEKPFDDVVYDYVGTVFVDRGVLRAIGQ